MAGRTSLVLVKSCVLFLLFSALAGFVAVSPNKVFVLAFISAAFIFTFGRPYFGLLLVFTLTPLLSRNPVFFGTADYSLSEPMLLAVLSNWIIGDVFAKRRIKVRFDAVTLALALFILFTAASSVKPLLEVSPQDFNAVHYSSDSRAYALKALLESIEGFLVFIMVLDVASESMRIMNLAYSATYAMGFVSFAGVMEYFAGGGEGASGVSSTLNNPNILGAYLVLFVPLAFALALRRDYALLRRFLVVFSILAALSCLFLAESRGAWLGLAAAVVAGVVFSSCRRRFRGVLPAALVLFLVAFSFLPSLGALDGLRDKNYLSRRDTYDIAFRMAGDNPVLGVGLGGFRRAYPGYVSAGFENGMIAPYVIEFIEGEVSFFGLVEEPGKCIGLRCVTASSENPGSWANLGVLADLGGGEGYNVSVKVKNSGDSSMCLWVDGMEESVCSRETEWTTLSYEFRAHDKPHGISINYRNGNSSEACIDDFAITEADGGRTPGLVHHAHNIFLHYAAERGVPAMLAFAAFLIMFYKKTLESIRPGDKLGGIRAALACGTIAVLIHGLLDYPLYSQRITTLFYFALGLILASDRTLIRVTSWETKEKQ